MYNIRSTTLIAAAAVAVITVGACSGSGSDTQTSATSSAAPAATSSQAPEPDAHNDADVAFAQGMIPHHQQAIEMSDMLLAKQGIDPRVEALAEEIKAAQGPEIAQMQGWLNQWGVPATTPGPSGEMSGMPGHDMSGGDMPGMSGASGMMSEADMAALQNAQGIEASRLFLTQMITHHQGAITMAQNEISSGQFPPAVALARSIESTQQQEIATMQEILDSL